MNLHSTETTQTNKQLRHFGLLTGSIFAVLFGLLFPWLGKHGIPLWPWIVAGLLWLPALFFPRLLQPVYSAWMKIGHILGWINTRIILGLFYILIIAPTGLAIRLLHKGHIQKLNRTQDASLRQVSQNRSPNHFERLF